MKKIIDTPQAFLIKIQVLYDIEKQLEKALPKMQKAANDPDLRQGFDDHLEETRNHITRLEQIFSILDATPKKTTSDGIRGIIEDGEWVLKVEAPTATKDIMLAGTARYAEHYEMAGYMTAILEADGLGLSDVAEMLRETLAEEQIADEKLADAISKNF